MGILTALPEILEENERVEYLSLGAGNTGRQFDLETDRRIAEFKFINWKDGSESIRQNSLFKNFYQLAEAETDKKKCLYVLGLIQSLKFFRGRRALSSVLSRNAVLAESVRSRYGNEFTVVNEYYEAKKELVRIVDLAPVLPALVGKDG